MRGKFTKKISIFFYFSIHFSFSFSFSTNNNLKKGHFDSPLLHFRETFATDCPNFINLSSFYGLVFAATHKTFSSFARKIENEKLFSNCDLRDQFFPEREFFPFHHNRHIESFSCCTENSLRKIHRLIFV